MANMTFKASLLPNTNLGYSLGSEDQRWKINGYTLEDTYVKKSGDTMSGTLTIKKSEPTYVLKNTSYGGEETNARVTLTMTNTGHQGLWSSGYFDGTNYTTSGKWLIERQPNGEIIVNGNASSADKWKNTRTLTIGNKSQNIDGSNDISYSLHDINYTNIAIGTATSWNYTTPGVYGVASSAAFTGEGHPESTNGGLTPYRYGQLLVYRANNYGISQFYISHHDSSSSNYGIKYRTGWNSNYESTWSTLLDNTNYTQYTVTKTGEGASGTWGINITGNSATTTKLATARTIWGQSFNGTANISGQMNDVGPGMHLPAGQTTFQFLTSANYAGNGYFGKVGLSGNYADINSNIGSHSLYVNGSTRVQSAIYRPSDTLGSSWVGSRSLSNMCIAVDASDSTSSVAYSLCGIKFPSKTFAISSERANPQFGIYGWNNSRTENGYDWAFYLANNGYFYANTRIYGAVWNDYAEKRNIPEAQETDWKDEECAAHPYAGRCVKENGDDTMSFSTERLQKGCKIISDTFGYCVGETNDCKTPIAVSGRVLAYLLEDREIAKEHIGDFVCSGPNGTVSIMTTEEYFKCPQAVVGTISAVPDYEEWGTGHVKVDGRIWIYVR